MSERVKQLEELRIAATAIPGNVSVVAAIDEEIEHELKAAFTHKINTFANGWKPLNTLNYRFFKNKRILIWCEFPHSGEARWCTIKHLDGTYVVCNVKFLYHDITQGAVAWCEDYNKNLPYFTDEQRSVWREMIWITDVRTIKY